MSKWTDEWPKEPGFSRHYEMNFCKVSKAGAKGSEFTI